MAYFGPRTKILEYFEGIGLKCPNWMNPADFLVAVMVRPDDFRCGEQQFVHSTQDFADVYAEVSFFFLFFLLFLFSFFLSFFFLFSFSELFSLVLDVSRHHPPHDS